VLGSRSKPMIARSLVAAVSLLLSCVIHGQTDLSGLAVIDFTRPNATSLIPAANSILRSFSTIEVFFSEDVSGVDAADLLVNGVPATEVSSFGEDQYVFTFDEPSPGVLNVSWAGANNIQDLAGNPVVTSVWTYTYDPTLPQDAPVLSEFVADNRKTLNDENGDSSDWIEILNPGSDPLELTGWYLSNDTNNLVLWQFPAITLEPNSYLIVFASGKNRTNTNSKLHANFKLSNNGGFLALVDPGLNAVSTFNYPAQLEDVSYGREPGNPTLVGFFSKPTPGAPNAAGGPGFAPKVQFSRKSGTFREPFLVTLTTDPPGAAIYYSTLGPKNLPTEASTLYTGPILITNTTHLRARAFAKGLLPGEPVSASYLSLTGSVANFTSDLPIVILHNYGAGAVPASGEQFVMMQIFEPKNGVAAITNSPDLTERARFRKRGSSSQDFSKASFSLEIWDEFNNDRKVPILGMPEESDWNFYAPNRFEPVLIHNPFMYELSREIGQYATRTRFVEVYLSTRGGAVASNNYNGIYVIVEKIKRGPDRVDVDKLEPEHLKPPEVTGGYMLKIDRPDPGDASFTAGGVSGLNYVDPKGPVIRTGARDPQEQYILGYFKTISSVLNNAALFTDPLEGYAKYIDVPASIDHHILNVLAFNVDALRLSTYLYKPRNGKLAWGPIWDFDRALGSTDGRDANPRSWGDSGGTSFFSWPLWNRMFQDPNFYQKWIDRWEELRRDQFSTSNFNRLIDQMTGEVRNAQPREYARWRSAAPVRVSYQNEINLMKNYLRNRAEFIDGQFVRPPVLNLPPGKVSAGVSLTLSGANAIYYTLDGTDPRASSGSVSPAALTYSGPITISSNARLVARSHKPGHTGGPLTSVRSPWSGVVSATFVVETPKFAITEIMYHPQAAPTGSTNSASDYEFVELKNEGETPLSLNGFAFTKGIDFVFTDGTLQARERAVIVKNRSAFQSRYGTSIPIAGEFTGSLDNDQQHLILQGPLQEPIADFTYNKSWYPITQGAGFSLVAKDESASLDLYGGASAWRQSAHVNGSPGAPDPTLAMVTPVYVNEVMAHPVVPEIDQVELYNPGLDPVSIGGWFLSDDLGFPRKYRIPAGTVIPAHGYLVLNENHFNAGNNAFGFSASGDEVYLFSADSSGELSGYVHGFQFDDSAPGVSFGRFITLDNHEQFIAQARPTFSALNSGPLIGPIILSELMFQPPKAGTNDNTLDEFIELENVSAKTVTLYDPAHPANTWHLRGGAEFEFPTGASIVPSGFILLVSFDPEADPGLAANFRAKYGLAANIPLYGPYRGQLSNSGERVTLLSPDSPANGSDPNYIVVDEVNYGTTLPWPTGASGIGKSLQRDPLKFGDDPFSWIAAEPNPASEGTIVDSDPDRDGLPSDWEIAYGLNPNDATGLNGSEGDADSDGSTNFQEYIAGTDPQNPSSILRLYAGQKSLTFQAVAGKSYSVFYKTNLSQPTWLKLVDIAAEAEGPKIIPDTSIDPVRFYRIVTPAQ
jgi:hypothetical protein